MTTSKTTAFAVAVCASFAVIGAASGPANAQDYASFGGHTDVERQVESFTQSTIANITLEAARPTESMTSKYAELNSGLQFEAPTLRLAAVPQVSVTRSDLSMMLADAR